MSPQDERPDEDVSFLSSNETADSHDDVDDDMILQDDSDLQPGVFSHDKLMINTDDYDEYCAQENSSDVQEESTQDASAHNQQDSEIESECEIDDDTKPQQSGGRYFLDSMDGGATCHNCGKPGHIARECGKSSNQPCFLCGQLGHTRNDCPNDLCYNCLRPGHQSRDCQQPKRRRFVGTSETCNNCGLPGHVQRDCSLSWRQYVFKKKLNRHLMNKESMNNLTMTCYHCANSGHFGDECPERTRGGYSIFHQPVYEYLELVAYRVTDNRRFRSRSPRKQPKYYGNMTYDNRKSYDSSNASRHTNHANGSINVYHRPQRGNRQMYRGGYKNKNVHE